MPQTSGFSPQAIQDLQAAIVDKLNELIPSSREDHDLQVVTEDRTTFSIGPFSVPKGEFDTDGSMFDLNAPTTMSNAGRVMRALQVPKPILLEGSPGVGKTSLVVALAIRTGNSLVRINLSDQTDLMDLFGSDLPVQGGKPGEFAWKDAAFLHALQHGGWVLLDEMNLAPQAVLEGLNAVLDHRGEVFIPELSRSFHCHQKFRIFAAQNPQHQGGGRKGLPKSFLNRFTKVHLRELDADDMLSIGQRVHPDIPKTTLQQMIAFNAALHQETMVTKSFGRAGTPWEFNLRDVLRWTDLLAAPPSLNMSRGPEEYLDSLYARRFRDDTDRAQVQSLFSRTGANVEVQSGCQRPWPSVTPGLMQVGPVLLQSADLAQVAARPSIMLQAHLPALQALAICAESRMMTILVGPDVAGKTSLARFIAEQNGRRLWECSMHGSIDTMDILGTFEQVDSQARLRAILARVVDYTGTLSQTNHVAYSTLDANVLKALLSPSLLLTDEALLSFATQCLDAIRVVDPTSTLLSELSNSLHKIDSTRRGPVFEWTDGPLVRAVKEGQWLFLDNANLCSPSVLDRLNSLCETNGSLILSECGLVDGEPVVLKPHPDFRLILGVNPRYGELSRAMRNRGLEVALDAFISEEDILRLQSLARSPSQSSNARPDLKVHAVSFELIRRGIGFPVSPQAPPQPVAVHRDSLSAALHVLHQVLPRAGTDRSAVLTLVGYSSISKNPVHLRGMLRYARRHRQLQDQLELVIRHIDPLLRAIRAALESVHHSRGVPLLFYHAQVSTDTSTTPAPRSTARNSCHILNISAAI